VQSHYPSGLKLIREYVIPIAISMVKLLSTKWLISLDLVGAWSRGLLILIIWRTATIKFFVA
jgi:hypothetical protein